MARRDDINALTVSPIVSRPRTGLTCVRTLSSVASNAQAPVAIVADAARAGLWTRVR